MILLAGSGLASNYLTKNRNCLNGVELKLRRLGLFGGEFVVEDDPPQTLSISAAQRLLISNFKGNIEISTNAQSEPIARLVKRIRANSQDEASQIAKNIHLQIAPAGKNLQFN